MRGTKKYKIVIREFALLNLDEIYFYIAFVDYRPTVAKNVIDAIHQTIKNKIALNPLAYRRIYIENNIVFRFTLCKNYKIIFTVLDNVIEIVAIIYSTRSDNYLSEVIQ
jgi:plasmid stabilization system protein ParE